MSESANRVTAFAAAALAVSLLLCLVIVAPRIWRATRTTSELSAGTKKPRVVGRVRSGTEVIAFFIASSTCGASANPRLPSALGTIRETLAVRARAEGKRFVYAGVALDETPDLGLAFLKKFAPFDEILTGGSWFGTGAVDFLIRGAPGPLAMPQLLIVERDVVAKTSGIVIGPDRVVARLVGFAEIFKMAGMPESDTGMVAVRARRPSHAATFDVTSAGLAISQLEAGGRW